LGSGEIIKTDPRGGGSEGTDKTAELAGGG